MSELHTRVRNYLDKKKPRKVESVTDDVILELDPEEKFQQDWAKFKEEVGPVTRIIKSIIIVSAILTVMWAIAIIDIQNDCYLDKECREWVTNR